MTSSRNAVEAARYEHLLVKADCGAVFCGTKLLVIDLARSTPVMPGQLRFLKKAAKKEGRKVVVTKNPLISCPNCHQSISLTNPDERLHVDENAVQRRQNETC